MTASARRLSLALPIIVLAVAACGSAATPTLPATGSVDPTAPATPSQPATPVTTPSPSVEPGQGNVDEQYPELTVELGDGYVISVTDPAAKAWKFDVRGTGILAQDQLEIVVETGDIQPFAEARIHVGGQLVDVLEMDGMIGEETVSAGGCHPTLQVCFGSDSISVDYETGRATLVLERIEPGAFAVQGATADWPGEPFILGPWRTTEPFTTS